MHGGEPTPDMVGAHLHGPQQSWLAAWPGHHVCGLPTMYGFGSPPCIWVPHHVSKLNVSGIILKQASRNEMKTSEQTHARAVRKVPTNSWEQGPA